MRSKVFHSSCNKSSKKRLGNVPDMRDVAERSREVVKGWSLYVTMRPRTPLRWLLRHGEYKDGSDYPAEELPTQHAIWMPVLRWAEMGIPLKEPPLGTMGSAVGQIPFDGGDFLPFLIRYRGIVETPSNHPPELQLDQLKAEYPQFAHVIDPKPNRRKQPQ